jgi:hypothetical protein
VSDDFDLARSRDGHLLPRAAVETLVMEGARIRLLNSLWFFCANMAWSGHPGYDRRYVWKNDMGMVFNVRLCMD